MKTKLLILFFLGVLTSHAQSSGEIQENLFSHLSNEALLLTETGLIKETSKVKAFVSGVDTSEYQKAFSKAVNPRLVYEIGNLKTASKSYAVMFITQTNKETPPVIKFLVMFEKTTTDNDFSAIDTSRDHWMTLCNAHDAQQLVSRLYTTNAYYYNRGRLLKGTEAISSEYSYMNSPNYTLQLTPKHLVKVTDEIAYEIGQCSGSYLLPYMLVWKKQEAGNWQILMDSNY